MAQLICKANKKLVIPPKMRGKFPNEETLVIELEANVPKTVPYYVAEYYCKNYPKAYWLVDDQKTSEKISENVEKEEEVFDPVDFLTMNYERIGEAIEDIKPERKKLLAIGKTLKLTGNIYKQKNERIAERIIHDVSTKNSQQQEIKKHKGTD